MKITSVETIKDCFKHKGIWDKDYKLCLETSNMEHNCTLPFKGLYGCWLSHNKIIHGLDGRPIYKIEMPAWGPEEGANLKSFMSDLKDAITRHPDEPYVYWDADKKTIWRCYNEKSRPVGCNEKNAVLSNSPNNVTSGLRNLRKTRLINKDLWSMETPLDTGRAEYEKYIYDMLKSTDTYQTYFKLGHPDHLFSGRTGKKIYYKKKGWKKHDE